MGSNPIVSTRQKAAEFAFRGFFYTYSPDPANLHRDYVRTTMRYAEMHDDRMDEAVGRLKFKRRKGKKKVVS